jgi:hypothetical protein
MALEARGEGLFMSAGTQQIDGKPYEMAVILFDQETFDVWRNSDVPGESWDRLKGLQPGTPVMVRGSIRRDRGKVKFRLLDIQPKTGSKAA